MVKHALLWLVSVGLSAWLLPAFAQPGGSDTERLNPWDFECTSGVNCCEVVRTNTHPYRYAMVCDPNLPSAAHPIRVFGPKRGRAIAGWMANAQVSRWEGEALPGYPYDPPPACDPRCEAGMTCCAIGRFPDHRQQEVVRWDMWGRAYDGHVPATQTLQQLGRDIILENVSFEYCHAWWNENLAEQGLASLITDPTPPGAIPCGPEDLRSMWGDTDDPAVPVPPSRTACEEKVCPVCRETISLLGVRMAHPECERCIQENEARILACMEDHRPPQPDEATEEDVLIHGRYEVIGADGEIVRDVVTGLEWQRCAIGQDWNAVTRTCDGRGSSISWGDVRETYAQGEFRLPSTAELRTLVYCSSGEPASFNADGSTCSGDFARPTIVWEAFPDTRGSFWSISPEHGLSTPWHVRFSDGHDGWSRPVTRHQVRLVRAGP